MWRYAVVPPGDVTPFTQKQDTAVEYGPQQIGGKTYLCPSRSTSLVQYPYMPPDAAGIMGLIYSSGAMDLKSRFGLAEEPTIENINDITFTDYHLFGATVRILPSGAESAPKPPLATPQEP